MILNFFHFICKKNIQMERGRIREQVRMRVSDQARKPTFPSAGLLFKCLLVRDGAGQSQETGTPSRSPMHVARSLSLGCLVLPPWHISKKLH